MYIKGVPAGYDERALEEQVHTCLFSSRVANGTAVVLQNFVLSS